MTALLLLTACGPGAAAPVATQGGGNAAGAPSSNSSSPPPPLSPSSLRLSAPVPAPPEVAKAESMPPVQGVSGKSYLVMDAGSGKVLVAHNATDRRAPASLTKVMTAVLAIERGRLEETVTVDQSVKTLEDTASTLVGLLPGDQISVRDLLYGLMLWSGNDTALVLARHLSGSEAAFVALMNKRAQELQLSDTRFMNSHGLDARNHFSSAYDLARLTVHAMKAPFFRELAAAQRRRFLVSGEEYGMYNLNALLTTYPGADGVKVGFTDNAGQTIIGSAVRDGRRLIVVVLGSQNRWADAALLLDLGFAARAGS